MNRYDVNNPSNSLMSLRYDRMKKIKEFILEKKKRNINNSFN